MSHRVGELAEKLDKVRDITAICIFVALVFAFKFSQEFKSSSTIKSEDNKIDVINVEKVEITQQVQKVLAPAAVKIPVAMTEEEEDTEESAALDIEEANFDAETAPPPPPPPPTPNKVEDDEAVEIYLVQEQPTMIGGNQVLYQYAAAAFPAMAKRSGTSGKVTLHFVVSKEGMPTEITILSEKPKDTGFGDAAISALMKVRFKPGMQGDKPVRVRMALPINFNIK